MSIRRVSEYQRHPSEPGLNAGARTHAELIGWWEILDKLSRETKSSNEPRVVEATDPIKVAVANVGRPNAQDEVTAAEEQAAKEQAAAGGEGVAANGSANASNANVVAPAVEEDDDEVSGGSSAEEEDDEARQIRTAPTTPAVTGSSTSPLDAAGSSSAAPAESSHAVEATETDALPDYQGNPNNISVR